MTEVTYDNLTYESFQRRAVDSNLSEDQKIGFPDEYRKGKSNLILADLVRKLPSFAGRGGRVADIGCGCGGLVKAILEHCERQAHEIFVNDGEAMLSQLRAPKAHFVAGRFPDQCPEFLRKEQGKMDVVICYSVLQYVELGEKMSVFFQKAISLLAGGGQALFGDIPNAAMRNRFFSSADGIRCHRQFAKDDSPPPQISDLSSHINDDTVLSLLKIARNAGFHAFVVPQGADLPMNNRREDILVMRP